MDFYDLPLDDQILDALDAMKFYTCTPIQEKTIMPLLEGKDLIGVAQTGTGKTAAYLLPVLNELNTGNYPQDSINCLIMAPTRELAQQIDQQVEGFSYFMSVSGVAVYGGNDGVRYETEKKGLRQGADIVVATPGRLISHIATGNVDLSKTSFFILDEADRMLDMGFYDDIMKIVSLLPKERQTIMFSATMPDNIQKLANNILNNPVEVKIAVSKPAENIKQNVYICNEGFKLNILDNILSDNTLDRVIVFASKKSKVKDISIKLNKKGVNAGQMHSDLTQAERDEIMLNFKNRKISVLVATDIVSRGIDIDDIQMVINFDVPKDPEDYVHRIGRTARANKDGIAITLVSPTDFMYLAKIEKLIGKSLERNPLPKGCGESPEFSVAVPSKKRKKQHRHSRGKGHSQEATKTAETKAQSEENNKRHKRKPSRKAGTKTESKAGTKAGTKTGTNSGTKAESKAPVAANDKGTAN